MINANSKDTSNFSTNPTQMFFQIHWRSQEGQRETAEGETESANNILNDIKEDLGKSKNITQTKNKGTKR